MAEEASASQMNFLVGRIVGFHGLSGEVKIRPATNSPEILLNITTVRTKATPHYPSVELKIDGLTLEKRMLFASFQGYPDRTSVQHLEGADLYTADSQLSPLEEEEFWVRDLIGLEVYTTEGRLVGKVVDIIYGGNDLLEIKSDEHPAEKSILVPFVKNLVPGIDFKSRRIEVIDVPGLLEPQ